MEQKGHSSRGASRNRSRPNLKSSDLQVHTIPKFDRETFRQINRPTQRQSLTRNPNTAIMTGGISVRDVDVSNHNYQSAG